MSVQRRRLRICFKILHDFLLLGCRVCNSLACSARFTKLLLQCGEAAAENTHGVSFYASDDSGRAEYGGFLQVMLSSSNTPYQFGSRRELHFLACFLSSCVGSSNRKTAGDVGVMTTILCLRHRLRRPMDPLYQIVLHSISFSCCS
jgi:hypothetical protein